MGVSRRAAVLAAGVMCLSAIGAAPEAVDLSVVDPIIK